MGADDHLRARLRTHAGDHVGIGFAIHHKGLQSGFEPVLAELLRDLPGGDVQRVGIAGVAWRLDRAPDLWT